MNEPALPRIVPITPNALPIGWRTFFAKHRIQLHVLVLYENEAENGKYWPAREIIARGLARGDHRDANTVIDSTSGNFGVSLATVVRQENERDPGFPIKNVACVVPISLPQGKRDRLEKHGVRLINAKDSLDAMRVAKCEAQKRGWWLTGQYWNVDNSRGYWRIAGHIAEKLPMLGMAAWGVGSGGGCSGVMPVLDRSFAQRSFKLHRVAVVLEDGHKIGGVRDEAALEPGTLKWRAPNIDDVCFVEADPSYKFSAALWREGIPVGPSTGFACEGASQAARKLAIMRLLDTIRAPDGFVHILAPALDKRGPYRSEYGDRKILFSSPDA
ncbi:pyridoxal-phosphate dependent enzyme [Candidatus Kaiserbacteria bacterium]|nr:pyridoxal-phosphate dependent enzyme [Candidatus Kaiserbacteria bacterium]